MSNPDRTVLLNRWFALTRRILPAMAAGQRWPIRYDHCFMRVCLDEAMGAPWRQIVKRPAIHHMTDEQLAAAIDVAERIAAQPELLRPLNERSLCQRGRRVGCASPHRSVTQAVE